MPDINNESPPSPPNSSIFSTYVPDRILNTVYGIGMNVNLVIGSGIVTAPGIIWNEIKSPKIVILLWIIGGIVAMSGSLSYAELGFYHRISGGETKYLQTAYPEPKDMMSYIFSCMFIFAIRPGILSAVLQSASHYFWYTVNENRFTNEDPTDKIGWKLHFSPFWVIKLTAVIMLAVITAYHMLSNKYANYINQILAVIKLITYTIISAAGIYKLCTNPQSRSNWKRIDNTYPNITSISKSILMVMFSYDGWNTLNYSLDEFKKPDTMLIYSNSISVLIVTIVYIIVNIAFISVVPIDYVLKNLKNENSTEDEIIAGTFFSILFERNHAHVDSEMHDITPTAKIFTTLVVISVMGTAATIVWSGSRVIVAAAKSNFFLGFSDSLKTWDKRFNTPVNALLLQFVWSSIFIIFIGSSFNITSFTLFTSFSMYSYWIFYLATGIGLVLIRHRIIMSTNNINSNNNSDNGKDEEQPPSLHSVMYTEELYKAPLHPVPIIIFILSGVFILTFSFFGKNMAPFFISLGFLLISLLIYYLWRRRMLALYG